MSESKRTDADMQPESGKKKRAYILPHTHWDREWRYPIWQSRRLLIQFMEQLLAILDQDEDYRCFLLDGQVAPIEDYLEIVPEDRERVEKYVKAGRIAIGPWFTLPDLYPVDGESLVRNLLRGKAAAAALGGGLKVGYNSFGWGQTAQFPQIYAGFGLDFIVCAKKVSTERAPESEFLWQAPDGTTVLTTRLGEHARANFYFNTYLYAKYGINCMSSAFRYLPEKSGAAIHNAAPEFRDDDFFVTAPKLEYRKEWLRKSFDDAWQAAEATVLKDCRLFLNGTDFSTPGRQTSAMIQDLNELFEDIDFRHGRLEEYAADLHQNLDRLKLRTITGELRDGPSCDCSGNALASRMYLKIKNKQAQNQLLRFAEPLNSCLYFWGENYPAGLLNKAWDYLLKSHPHDSINGVTQDKTADDVEYRLAQALEIGRTAMDGGMEHLARRLDLSGFAAESDFLLLYNPNPWPVRSVVKVNAATAADRCVWSLAARDIHGRELPVQDIGRDEKSYPVHDTEARPWPFISHRHLFYLDAGELPAMGIKAVALVPSQHFNPEAYYWLPMRRREPDSILRGGNILENEHLRAVFQPNGTLNLTHKGTGQVYHNLHYFEDAGDVGNYWAYYPPYRNEIHSSLAGNARIWSEDSGPLSATIAVEYTMILPAAAKEPDYGVRGPSLRTGETAELKITSRFTLSRYAGHLEVHTTLDNHIKNHRLRVAFPTGITASCAHAAGHFTVDSRDVPNQAAADGSYWPEMQTLPMQDFVDVNDGDKGLALISNCFTEYELERDEHNTLYLTLFRAMGGMIVTWWEAVGRFEDQEGSQLQRRMEYHYGIYPHPGGWEQGGVYREAAGHHSRPAVWQLCGNAYTPRPQQESLTPEKSFMDIANPNVIFSALKPAENSSNLILRLYNPTRELQKTAVTTGFHITGVWRCMLNEERQEELTANSNRFEVELAPGLILTLELKK